MNCPCKDCTDRWVSESSNCHVSCKRYIEWAAYIKEYNRKESEQRRNAKAFDEIYIHRKKKKIY